MKAGAFKDEALAKSAVQSVGRDAIPIKSLLSTARLARAMSPDPDQGINANVWSSCAERTTLRR